MMRAVAGLLDVPPLGKALEVAWDHTALPIPRRRVVRRYADGRSMELDLADRTQRAMFCGAYEPAETAAVATILRPGSTFIDAGAHVGWFTILAAGRVGAGGAVHAVEAFPDNARMLTRNVARNAAQNVLVHHQAISDQRGSMVVGRQAGSDSGSVTAGPGATEAQVEVPTSTLDDMDTGDGPVALLKIDVEGLEARVFAAAPRTLRRVGTVMIEINNGALARNGSTQDELLGALAEAGLQTITELRRPLDGLRSMLAPTYRNLLVGRC